jgi:hypothetical protein
VATLSVTCAVWPTPSSRLFAMAASAGRRASTSAASSISAGAVAKLGQASQVIDGAVTGSSASWSGSVQRASRPAAHYLPRIDAQPSSQIDMAQVAYSSDGAGPAGARRHDTQLYPWIR